MQKGLLNYWGLIVGLFLSSTAAAKDFPQLYTNRVSSDNYEITKLVDGPIDSLYKNNRTNEYIAQTDSRLWKINSSGQLIDYFSSYNLYASGLILEKEGFIDWVFTGDKEIKPYGETLDAKEYSEQQLFAAFDQADAMEFVDKDETGLAYLYYQDQVSILDISNHRDKIDDFYYRQSVSKDYNLRSKETAVKASRFKKYKQKTPSVEFLSELNDEVSSPLEKVGFKKITQHKVRSYTETFFENTLGRLFFGGSQRKYSYSVGYSHYQLIFNNEKLKFSIFGGESYDSTRAWNFRILEGIPALEGENQTTDLLFATINYRRPYLEELNEKSLLPYYEQDVGLYAIRKKIPHNQTNNPQWQLSYSGLHAYSSIWGYIHFTKEEMKPVYYWFWKHFENQTDSELREAFGRGSNIASPILKSLPVSLDFHWKDFKRNRNFRLQVNNQDAEFYKLDDTEIAIRLYFDLNELEHAFRQFSGEDHTILLNLDLQERDFGGELAVSVQSKNKKIILMNTSLDYQEIPYTPKSPRAIPGKMQTELFLAYTDSFNRKTPESFLNKVNQLKQMNTIPDYASFISYYFAQLSYNYNFHRKFEENAKLINEYLTIHQGVIHNPIDELQHKNLIVLATQGIYLGANTKNTDLNRKIVQLFAEQDFDLSLETNRVFLFNIACYYAVNHNKPQMLKIINLAMELGKNPDDFLKDTDFTDYWKDPDFLNAIEQTHTQ